MFMTSTLELSPAKAKVLERGPDPSQLELSLGLPPGGYDPNGLVLTDSDMPEQDWLDLGFKLAQGGKWCRWAIGDWLLFGDALYDENVVLQATEPTPADRYDVARRITGLEEGTLRNRASLCSRVPLRNRRVELGISMHEAVAALPVDEQGAWLDKAIENSWDRDTLRKAIKGLPLDPASELEEGPIDLGDRVSASERAFEVLRLVYNQGQPTADGGALVPPEAWAQIAAVLGEE